MSSLRRIENHFFHLFVLQIAHDTCHFSEISKRFTYSIYQKDIRKVGNQVRIALLHRGGCHPKQTTIAVCKRAHLRVQAFVVRTGNLYQSNVYRSCHETKFTFFAIKTAEKGTFFKERTYRKAELLPLI